MNTNKINRSLNDAAFTVFADHFDVLFFLLIFILLYQIYVFIQVSSFKFIVLIIKRQTVPRISNAKASTHVKPYQLPMQYLTVSLGLGSKTKQK